MFVQNESKSLYEKTAVKKLFHSVVENSFFVDSLMTTLLPTLFPNKLVVRMLSYLIQAHVGLVMSRRVFGLGSTIGSDLFVVAAKNDSGSGLFLSFTIAGFSAFLSGFCYAEFSSRVAVAGSALEYGISASTVAIGWSCYLKSWMKDNLSHLVFGRINESDSDNAIMLISFAAPVLVGLVILIVVYRINASVNFIVVIIVWTLCVILLFIITGSYLIGTDICIHLCDHGDTNMWCLHFKWQVKHI